MHRVVLRIHTGEQKPELKGVDEIFIPKSHPMRFFYLQYYRHSCQELPWCRELTAVVDLFPLCKPPWLVIGSLADPMQEVQVGKVVHNIGQSPGQWHGQNRDRHQHDVERNEKEKVDDPNASPVPPGHLRIWVFSSISRAQHDSQPGVCSVVQSLLIIIFRMNKESDSSRDRIL